jgi:RNA polymerase sigma-70 factor (sigma-E family)
MSMSTAVWPRYFDSTESGQLIAPGHPFLNRMRGRTGRIPPDKAAEGRAARLRTMDSDTRRPTATTRAGRATRPPDPDPAAAEAAVTAIYQAHALGLIRLAHIMLGDRPSAEDVVQEAFCGLYRRWFHLSDTGSALQYLRTSVLNGCRSVLRRRTGQRAQPGDGRPAASAEATVISGEDRREVMQALRRLPARQREALVLRYYLDLSPEEIATVMGIGPSSVRSATHRALSSLGRMLKELS